MPQFCDLCGAREAKFKAKVAGTESMVCENCASLGQITEEFREPAPAEIRKIEKKQKEKVERTEDEVTVQGSKKFKSLFERLQQIDL